MYIVIHADAGKGNLGPFNYHSNFGAEQAASLGG